MSAVVTIAVFGSFAAWVAYGLIRECLAEFDQRRRVTQLDRERAAASVLYPVRGREVMGAQKEAPAELVTPGRVTHRRSGEHHEQ